MTVIIPTLYKEPRIYQTLVELSNCQWIDEIILIDNTCNEKKIDLPKLIHICEGVNTYVNPAWNKGAYLSKTEKLCFLNDDIWFDWDILGKISEYITKDVGMVGMSSYNYKSEIINKYQYQDVRENNFGIKLIEPNYKSSKGERPLGFGCCFFIHKANWVPIPEDIKIYAGDDWQFYANSNKNYIIEGIKIEGSIATTVDDSSMEMEFNSIKHNDMLLISQKIRAGLIDNYLIGTKWV
jgi:hypothetical protein